MLGVVDDLVYRSLLDDPAVVHHQHVIGDPGYDGQVMADQQYAAAVIGQGAQQSQDPRLHGDVERGGRFVGHQHVGASGQCRGDQGTLPQTAGELMRIVAPPVGRIGNAHGGKEFLDGRHSLPTRDPHRLGDLGLHGPQRVQRGQRVLQHEPDLAAAD